MLQASLSLFLSQVSSVKYKLIVIIMLKTLLIMPSFSMWCLPFISRRSKQKILRKHKRFVLPCTIPAFANVPWFIIFNQLCVLQGGMCLCSTDIFL